MTDYDVDENKLNEFLESYYPISQIAPDTNKKPYKPKPSDKTKQTTFMSNIFTQISNENEFIDQQRNENYYELGIRGLPNLINTCFLNSTLQCLLSCRSLVTFLLSKGPGRMGFVNLANTIQSNIDNELLIQQNLRQIKTYFSDFFREK